MKIITLQVISLDGRYTKWTGKNIYEWSSSEDFEHFVKIRSQNNLIVMGSATFKHVKDNEQAGLKAEKERLRVIMTRTPEKYEQYAVPGQIEFTDDTPTQVVANLEKRGYKQMLFAGGNKLHAAFLREKLIDEIWITVEPRIFGLGEMLASGEKLDINLQLIETKKLNSQGTLLLKYKVLK